MMKFFLYLIIGIIALFIIRKVPALLKLFTSGSNTPPKQKVTDPPKYDKSKVIDADYEELK